QAGTVAETADVLNGTDADPADATGTIRFADVDLSDDPSASHDGGTVTGATLANGYALTPAQEAGLLAGFSLDDAALSDFSSVTGTGSTGWTYSLGNADLDFLGANDSVTMDFVVTIHDGHGGTATETVTITVTGSNDAPVVTVADVTGSVTEDMTAPRQTTGSLVFADVDLSDAHDVTASAKTLPLGFALGTFAVVETSDTTGTGTGGGADWTYTLDNALAQQLAEGQTVEEVYTVTVDDGQGGLATRDITITITGQNDAPQVSAIDVAETLSETELALTTSGSFTVSDVDLLDVVSIQSVGVTTSGQNGDAQTPGEAALLAMFSALPTTVIDAASISGTVNWTFNAGTDAFDYLAVGESLQIVYALTMADPAGASVVQNVTITIEGTNDAPLIDGAATSTVNVALTESDAPLGTNGTLTISDVDTTDVVGLSVTLATSGNDSDPNGPTQAELLAMMSVPAAPVLDGATTSATAGWTFASTPETFDFLAAGESLILTYTITATDDNGAKASKDVVVTITGSNDLPVIDAGATTATGSVLEDSATPLLTVGGVVTFSDLDHSDTHTASVTADAGNTVGGIVTLSPVTDDTATTPGTVNWTYNLANGAAQWLAAGEKVTETFTLAIDDGHGGKAEQVISVDVTGVNDPTVIGFAQANGAVVEDDAGAAHTGGIILFSDADLKDVHIVSVTLKASTHKGTLGTFTADKTSDTTGTGSNGLVTWSYDIDQAATQKLAAGQELFEVYTVSINDQNGHTATQDVRVTITGANDAPVISVTASDSTSTALSEDTDAKGTSVPTGALLGTHTGSLSVSDVDLLDSVTASVKSVTASETVPGLDNAGLKALMSLSANPVIASGASSGTIDWTFTGLEPAFDYLAMGAVLTLAYEIEVTDSAGAKASETVTVTITGSNDTPAITIAAGNSAATTLTEDTDSLAGTVASGALSGTASGTLSVTDLDLADSVSASVTAVVADKAVPGLDNAALLALLSVAPDPVIAGGSNSGTLTWTFTGTEPQFDYLDPAETLTLTYTVTATDTNGFSDTQAVTITIEGRNDGPVVTSTANDAKGSVIEAGAIAIPGNATTGGTLTPDDIDHGATLTWSHIFDPAFQQVVVSANSHPAWGAVMNAFSVWMTPNANVSAGDQPLFMARTVSIATTGDYTFKFAADDTGTVYVDGIAVVTTNSYAVGATATVHLTAGDHIIRIEADNFGANNPAGVALQILDGSTNVWNTRQALAAESSNLSVYGTFSIAADGTWSFVLDDSRPATQALAAGQVVTEDFRVQVSDENGARAYETVSVTITGTNDAPFLSSPQSGLANGTEDTGLTLTRTVLLENVTDFEGDALAIANLTVSSGSATPAGDDFSYTPAADYSGPVTVSYDVIDGNGGVLQITRQLTIDPVTDTPTVTTAPASGAEDATAIALSISAAVTDASETITAVTISGVTNGTLSAGTDQGGGVWSLTQAQLTGLSFIPDADFNGTVTLSITATAKDGAAPIANSAAEALLITVTPVNDAPKATGETLSAIDEDSGVRIIDFATLLANDTTGPANESTETLTITAVSNVIGGTAVINGTTIEFTPTADYNGPASFTYTVTDNGQTGGADDFLSDTATANFTINPVADAPEGADKTITLSEDGSHALTAADFGFTDPKDSPADAFLGVMITSLPTAGSLTLDGAAMIAGRIVSIDAIHAGKLVFTPDADANGTGYSTLTFQVQDDGTLLLPGESLDPSANTLTFNVTPVNDAPTVSGPVDLGASNEDAPLIITSAEFLANASDIDGDALTVSNVTVSTGTVVDNNDGTFTFTPAADDDTAVTFSYTVSDGTVSIPATATLDLTPVNDAPVLSSGGSTPPIHLWAGEGNANDSVGTLNGNAQGGVSYVAGQDGLAFNFDGADDRIVVTRDIQNDFTISGWIKTTQDFGGGSQFYQGKGLVSGERGNVVNDFGVSLMNNHIAFGMGNPAARDFTIESTSTVNTGAWVHFAAVREGSEIRLYVNGTLEASVDTGSTNALTAPNDLTIGSHPGYGYYNGALDQLAFFDKALSADEIVAVSTGGGTGVLDTIEENQTALGSFSATDIDGDALTFSISGGADAALFDIDANTGALSFKVAPDFENPQDAGGDNVYDVTVEVSDGALTDSIDLAVTVQNVNEAPVITSNGGLTTAALSVAENTTAVTTVAATDPEGTALTYAITGGADAALFDIDPGTGVLTFKSAPDFENAADDGGNNVYDVIVEASDGLLTDTQTLAITVTDVPEAPTASNDAFSTDEDTPLVLTAAQITGNDINPPGAQPLQITGVGNAVNGTVALNGSTVTFTPNADFNGAASFTYTIDNGAGTDTATVDITVDPVNDAPVITVPVATNGGLNGAATTLPVTFGNTNDGAEFFTKALPNGGTATVSPDSANLVITDGTGTVLYNGPAGESYGGVVLAGEIAVLDSDTFVVTWVEGRHTVFGRLFNMDGTPESGDVQLSDTGAFVDSSSTVNTLPGGDFVVTWKSWNGAQYDVRARIFDADMNPVAGSFDTGANNWSNGQSATVLQNGNIAIVYLLDDDGNNVRQSGLVIVQQDGTQVAKIALDSESSGGLNPNSQGRNGIATLADGRIVAVVAGLDANDDMKVFAHLINPDGTRAAAPITVAEWTGNDFDGQRKPEVVALPDGGFAVIFANERIAATDTGGTVHARGVYVQQFDANGAPVGDPIFVSDTTHPQIDLTADGDILAAVYNGSIALQKITPASAGPSIVEDSSGTIAGISIADTDAGADPISVTLRVNRGALSFAGDVSALTFTDADGSDGSLAFTGSQADINAALASLTYHGAPDHSGTATLTIVANDQGSTGSGGALSDTKTLSIAITPVNDAPVAVANAYTTKEDQALYVDANSGVLYDDTDADGDTLTAVLVRDVSNGTLVLNANGSFTYTPNANFHGTDSFDYKVNDGTVDGNTVTVTFTVSSVNDVPVTVEDSYVVDEDKILTVNAANGLLANDSDGDGDTIYTTEGRLPAHGFLDLKPDGSFTYRPDANFSGTDSFTYRAYDGEAVGNTVTVTLTVNPVNDTPVSVADAYSMDEDGTLVVAAAAGVLANDSDVETPNLTAILVSDVSNGVLTFNADGSFNYVPDANFNGTDSFTYKANDGTEDGNTVTVTMTVNSVEDIPVAVADAYSVDEDMTLTVSAANGVLVNDSDGDGDTIYTTEGRLPAHGFLDLQPDGSFTYRPDANFSGTDSFTYIPHDGKTAGNEVTVTLTVNPVNDAPVAVANAY
ncbi:MAG: tandem-95 repeat protein, partial [Hyphomicrobiaceae bacterium]|nr:tandem-95 repeat protein [Hyphomicrobiaceae bacterium]